jgi:hypothetical protein
VLEFSVKKIIDEKPVVNTFLGSIVFWLYTVSVFKSFLAEPFFVAFKEIECVQFENLTESIFLVIKLFQTSGVLVYKSILLVPTITYS